MAKPFYTEDVAPKKVEEPNWLVRMNGFLDWKVLGPDLHNPYRAPFSDRVLVEMANRREVIAQHFDVRCMCDGYEVLVIKNFNNPHIRTDHPCLTKISVGDVLEYMDENGVTEKVHREMDRIQSEIKEELALREIKTDTTLERRTDTDKAAAMAAAKKEREQLQKPKSGRRQARIIRK